MKVEASSKLLTKLGGVDKDEKEIVFINYVITQKYHEKKISEDVKKVSKVLKIGETIPVTAKASGSKDGKTLPDLEYSG